MVTAGTNCLTLQEDAMITALPKLTAFQTWTGSATEAAAITKLFLDALDEPVDGNARSELELRDLNAWGHVFSATSQGYQRRVDASNNDWNFFPRGVMLVELFRVIPGAEGNAINSHSESSRYFRNVVGNLMNEIELHFAPNGLSADLVSPIRTLTMNGPTVAKRERNAGQGDLQQGSITIEWWSR